MLKSVVIPFGDVLVSKVQCYTKFFYYFKVSLYTISSPGINYTENFYINVFPSLDIKWQEYGLTFQYRHLLHPEANSTKLGINLLEYVLFFTCIFALLYVHGKCWYFAIWITRSFFKSTLADRFLKLFWKKILCNCQQSLSHSYVQH